MPHVIPLDALTLSWRPVLEHYPRALAFAAVSIAAGSMRPGTSRWVGAASAWHFAHQSGFRRSSLSSPAGSEAVQDVHRALATAQRGKTVGHRVAGHHRGLLCRLGQ